MLDVKGHEQPPQGAQTYKHPGARRALIGLLGPAFVASIAYVDPGNVAANLTAGAQYGYLLVWVLVAANIMAVLVQYQSAKLGIVTGKSLPEILGERLKPFWRRAFWLQAEVVAAATDLAEVVGGAIALNLLFGLPLPLGAVIVGAVSMLLLAVQARQKQRPFEFIIMFLLGIITIGFLAGLFISPPDPRAALAGLVPGFQGPDTVLLAASMLGATVMPHAIYVHSALSRDRHRPDEHQHVPPSAVARLVRATRLDVVAALAIAGLVNIGMLLLAASTLGGEEGTDTIEGAHAAITANLGPHRRRGLRGRAPRVRPGIHLGGLLCRRNHHAGPAQDPDPCHGPPRRDPDSGRCPAGGRVRPHVGARLEPGGPQLRDPLCPGPAGGADQQ